VRAYEKESSSGNEVIPRLYLEAGLVEMPSEVTRELPIRPSNHLVVICCNYERKEIQDETDFWMRSQVNC